MGRSRGRRVGVRVTGERAGSRGRLKEIGDRGKGRSG